MDRYVRACPVNAHTRETHSHNRRIHAFNRVQTAPDAHLGLRLRGGHLQCQRYATLTYFTARDNDINQRSISRSSPHSQTRVLARLARDAHTPFIHPIDRAFLTHTKRHRHRPIRARRAAPRRAVATHIARRDARAYPPPIHAHRIPRGRPRAHRERRHHTDPTTTREQPSRPPHRARATGRRSHRPTRARRHRTATKATNEKKIRANHVEIDDDDDDARERTFTKRRTDRAAREWRMTVATAVATLRPSRAVDGHSRVVDALRPLCAEGLGPTSTVRHACKISVT